MPTTVAVSHRAVWGLWCCLTLAALGLTLLFAGAVAHRTETLWPGGALMAFSVMLYLILHFWATASVSFAARGVASEPVPRPAPSSRPRAVATIRSKPRIFDDRVGWDAHAPAMEETLQAAPTAPRAVAVATNGHTEVERPVQSAVERRKDWIDQMPLAKSILGTPPPAPALDEVPDGKTRGRCSGCNTILLAPATRPLRLRCPTCGRVAWIK